MASVLALDQGTTGSTALLIGDDGHVRGRGYREIAQYHPQPGWVEHDPEEISAIQTYVIVSGANERVLLALLVSLVVGAIIGFFNGAGITFLKISPFVMTLSMAGVVTGAIIVIHHGNVQGKIAPIMTRLIARPLSPGIPIPNALIIWLIFGILMWLLMERTTYGKHLFAIGVNRVTSKLSGVNVNGMNLATYALAGALAGFGGFLVVGNTGLVMIQLGQPFLGAIR